MRIDLNKFLFIGVEDEREEFFKKAQEIGVIHFIDARHKAKVAEMPEEIAQISAAIKVLRGLPTADQEAVDSTKLSFAEEITRQILDLKQHEEKLWEEARMLRLDSARVHAFGNFSKDDISYIEHEGKRKIQYFFARNGVVELGTLPENVIFLSADHGMDYFISISPELIQVPKLIEMRIDHPLGELKKRLHEVQIDIHDTETRLKGFAKYNVFLHHALVLKMNAYHLEIAKDGVEFTVDDRLFAVEGWVPVNKIETLNQIAEKMHVYIDEVAIEEEDRIPTCLQNEGANRLGEDLVNIYDVPSNTDKDPSLWVLIFFAFFFAFIINDGGYGLVFLATTLFLSYKLKLGKTGVRVMKLFAILSVFCIGWGILTASFFGMSFAPDSPMKKVSVVHWLVEKKTAYHIAQHDEVYQEWVTKYPQLKGVTDPDQFILQASEMKNGKLDHELLNKFNDNIMMELALVVGIIHIILSFLRYIGRNKAGIGWIIFVIGGYLYFPYYLHATSMVNYLGGLDKGVGAQEGLYMMYGGIILAVGIGMIKHKFAGLLEIMASVQIFSDILSYLRLYALALAGAIVAEVINDMTSSMNIVIGVLVMIVAHLINIVLSIMSGVIHGLRLNFLEWYHYSFEGGGKRFEPLHKIKIEE